MTLNQSEAVCPDCKTRFNIPSEVCEVWSGLGTLNGKCSQCGKVYKMTNYIEPFLFTAFVVDWNWQKHKQYHGTDEKYGKNKS